MTAIEARKVIQDILGVANDGFIGPITRAAFERLVVAPPGSKWPGVILEPAVDPRSEAAISTLVSSVQPLARMLVKLAAEKGITIKIISGLRTYEEQDHLYEIGRTKPGRIVTHSRGGQSWHNHGVAFDVGVFEGSKYIEESPHYKTVGLLGESIGLEWGGRFKSFVDEPHFQFTNGKTLAQAQSLRSQGKTVFS